MPFPGLGFHVAEEISYLYRIEYDDGIVQTFDIRLDPHTLNHTLDLGQPPIWGQRREFGCVNPSCPLREDDLCPCARTTQYLLNRFGDVHSTHVVTITATTRQRTSTKRSAIQSAVSSIAGILMATCGCPILARFKPMVRYHLPFASLEETEYRVFTMYALAQFIRARHNLDRDHRLGGLRKFYEEIQEINQLAARKICINQNKDATINGLVMLDAFAQNVSMILDADDMEPMETLFSDWLK